MEFEWDKEKARTNFDKHSVSFEEAALAFFDENAVELLMKVIPKMRFAINSLESRKRD